MIGRRFGAHFCTYGPVTTTWRRRQAREEGNIPPFRCVSLRHVGTKTLWPSSHHKVISREPSGCSYCCIPYRSDSILVEVLLPVSNTLDKTELAVWSSRVTQRARIHRTKPIDKFHDVPVELGIVPGHGIQARGRAIQPVAGRVHLLDEVGQGLVQRFSCLVQDGDSIENAVGSLGSVSPLTKDLDGAPRLSGPEGWMGCSRFPSSATKCRSPL